MRIQHQKACYMNTSGCFVWEGSDISLGRCSKCSPAAADSEHGPWSPVLRCVSCTYRHTFPARKKESFVVLGLSYFSSARILILNLGNSVSKYLL